MSCLSNTFDLAINYREDWFFVRSNLAVYSVRELHTVMKKLESDWEDFIVNNRKPDNIRVSILQSWERCQQYHINPLQKHSQVSITNENLIDIIDQSQLYHASLPILNELHNQIEGTSHLITLTDDNGRIIYLQGSSQILTRAHEMNFKLGADWSEKSAGSNAIGTSLALGHPIQIFSFEHYCQGVHPWVCSAAPIKDPTTGKTLGIIDLTGPSDLAQPHSLSLVQSVATTIQQCIRTISSKTRGYLQDYYDMERKRRKSDCLIVLDEHLNIVHAGTKCKSLLQLEYLNEWVIYSELQSIKTSILCSHEHKLELDSPVLQLKIYVQTIVKDSKRIGFLLQLEKRTKHQPSTSHHSSAWKEVIGQSNSLKQEIYQAQVVAATNVPILLTGESGTGKEIFAKAIHKASLRQNAPFISINCGAIPKELISSELFGYEPGAFTGGRREGKKGKFEEANGGTLLLDEIGEMPLDLQVHLLRVLQEKEIVRLGSSQPIPIDVRIIAATNQNLTELIENNKFRMDLYYRLNVVELTIPPLRERKSDLLLLTRYFAFQSANTHGKEVPDIDSQVLSLFHNYHWPGNIRELKNIIEYAVLFCKDQLITMDVLPKSLHLQSKLLSDKQICHLSPLEQEEKRKIEQLLTKTDFNLSEVARQCDIARSTLYRKMEKYQLHVK